MSDAARWRAERAERRSGLRRAAREARADGRQPIEVAVRFYLGGERIVASAKNLSVGGMLIATDTPAPFGEAITVEIDLPGMTELARIPSVVRWTNAEGMGVQFGAMGARETHGLLALLRG